MTTSGQPSVRLVPDEVRDLSKFAANAAAQLRSGSASLDREIQSLFGTWKGSAADAYRAGWDEMHDGLTKAWAALSDIAEKLGMNALAFEGRDDANASSLNEPGLG